MKEILKFLSGIDIIEKKEEIILNPSYIKEIDKECKILILESILALSIHKSLKPILKNIV